MLSKKLSQKLHYVKREQLEENGIFLEATTGAPTMKRRRELVTKSLPVATHAPGRMLDRADGPRDRASLSDDSVVALGNRLAGKTISTYPMMEPNRRFGHPIADRFELAVFERAALCVVCDGCGVGVSSSDAARAAAGEFITHFARQTSRETTPYTTTHDYAQLLLSCVVAADAAIGAGDRIVAGTTTLIAGLVLTARSGRHVLLVVSVGDCKAYLWSANRPGIFFYY